MTKPKKLTKDPAQLTIDFSEKKTADLPHFVNVRLLVSTYLFYIKP